MPKIIKNDKVVYVEPNIAADFTAYNSVNLGDVNKSVDLEDLSIIVELEVEVKGRVNGEDGTINMKWESGSKGEHISFMQGTKIPTHDGGFVRSLTTNYTDFSFADIENTGTAEMFGIKSIDINYTNFMVPEVTIQFTDVRGISLFAQEEMRHNLSSKNGMEGIANNSIEGSFFKCFFSFPYPKFTLKVKGFYGEMVSYELTCADFRAAFDANSGNFNVTARFVGFAFSFLGDVMANGLVSAPYCEYLGKKYWEDNVSNGRFVVENRDTTKVAMQKLGYIVQMFKQIVANVSDLIKEDGWMAAAQEANLDEKQKELLKQSNIDELKLAYQSCISKLKDIVDNINKTEGNSKNTNKAFKVKGDYAIITSDKDTIGELSELIASFNNLDTELRKKKGYNSSLDKWLNYYKFQIEEKEWKDYRDVVKDAVSGLTGAISEIAKQKTGGKIYVPGTIWNSGKTIESTYFNEWSEKDVFIYKDNGLSKLLGGQTKLRSENELDITKIQENIEKTIIQKEFLKVFQFEPSVENITKIIMAHVETFIHMISRCSDNIVSNAENRSLSRLNVSADQFPDIGRNEAIRATNDTPIPPFPKVTKTVEENGVKKVEDAWIGDILTQDQAEEIKLVEGILDGITEAANDMKQAYYEGEASEEDRKSGPLKYPLTYFDLFLDENDKVFGNSLNLKDLNNVFASVCVRAFAVLATQGGEFGTSSTIDATTLGKADADNFLNTYQKQSDIKILGDAIKSITTEQVLSYLSTGSNKIDSSKKNNPWYKKTKLIAPDDSSYRLTIGWLGGKHAIFPIRNWTFKNVGDSVHTNTENPQASLKSNNMINYITTTSFDDTKDNTNSPLIIIKEQPLTYIKRRYSKTANSDYESNNNLSSLIFKDSPEIDLDVESWAEKFNKWKLFRNNDGQDTTLSSAIEYDTDGSVSSTNNCAIKFHNFFLEKKFANMDSSSKAREFINYVFIEKLPKINSLETYEVFTSQRSKLRYFPKFQVLLDGVTLLNKRDIKAKTGFDSSHQRSVINTRYNRYFQDWAYEFFAKINSIYTLQFKTGRNIDTLLKAIQNSDQTYEGVLGAFEKNLDTEYFTTFRRVYEPVKIGKQWTIETISSTEMDKIIKDLMKIVAVSTTSKFNYRKSTYETNNSKDSTIRIDKSKLNSYFNGFIETLKNKLDVEGDGSSTDASVRTTDTEVDLKVGIYNYIKMLYDKWLATNTQKDFYKIEKLFTDNDHTFYFLDSAYNDIGKTMYLNLSSLVDRIVQCQTSNGYTLLSLLSSMFSDNKFLFLCIQNFLDLSKADLMDKMFKPLPYIDCEKPNNNPNFIVLMPYEPSSKLDIKDGNYPDDTFYLDNEETWPEMIKSKNNEGSLPIPAFGVCYGQQYQNYFKNIQVDMNSPMTTEQSIKAKFMIAGANSGRENDGIKVNTVGQDLYTIYSNNSYTCTVTMMGCAWIQPMMYFVLQNVPMFRGSYMIVKVNHQITPGNMVTTFKGVRMAKTATRSVKDFIFGGISDSVSGGMSTDTSSTAIDTSSHADVKNDCKYAYYSPLVKKEKPNLEERQAYCYALYSTLIEKVEKNGAGLTESQAKGICANIYKESAFNPYIVCIDGNGEPVSNPNHHHEAAGGLCMFNCGETGGAIDLFRWIYENETDKEQLAQAERQKLNDAIAPYWKGRANQSADTNQIWAAGIRFPVSFEKQVEYIVYLTKKSPYNDIRLQRTEADAAHSWMVKYERPANQTQNRWNDAISKWVNSAIDAQRDVVHKDDNSNKPEDSIEKIASGLRDSVEGSLRANKSYKGVTVDMTKLSDNTYEYKINDRNASGALFDCLLSSYGKWFDKIGWNVGMASPNSNAESIRIRIVKTEPSSHDITILTTDVNGEHVSQVLLNNQINENLRVSLVKYFKNKGVSDPKVAKSIFKSCMKMTDNAMIYTFELNDNRSVQSCGSVTGTYTQKPNGTAESFENLVTNPQMKKVLSDVSHYYVGHNYNKQEYYRAVKGSGATDAKTDKGKCTFGPSTWYNNAGKDLHFWSTNDPATATLENTQLSSYGMTMYWSGTVEQAKGLNISTFKPGDVCTQYYWRQGEGKDPSAHACMWTGKDWRSDFVQGLNIMANNNFVGRRGDKSVCLWRNDAFQDT